MQAACQHDAVVPGRPGGCPGHGLDPLDFLVSAIAVCAAGDGAAAAVCAADIVLAMTPSFTGNLVAAFGPNLTGNVVEAIGPDGVGKLVEVSRPWSCIVPCTGRAACLGVALAPSSQGSRQETQRMCGEVVKSGFTLSCSRIPACVMAFLLHGC